MISCREKVSFRETMACSTSNKGKVMGSVKAVMMKGYESDEEKRRKMEERREDEDGRLTRN